MVLPPSGMPIERHPLSVPNVADFSAHKESEPKVGRIAYLSKRGNIWWFRRRHPVIVIPSSKIGHETKVCSPERVTVQAKGHLAISLGTTSVREARLLSSCLSAGFERAWAMVEGAMSERDGEEDFIDAMAMTITEGFRKQIKMFRAVGASRLDARVREKAYAILEADLRGALELAAETKPMVAAAGVSETDAHAPTIQYYSAGSEWDDVTPEIIQELAELAMRDPSEVDFLSHQEHFDQHLIQSFEMGTFEFRATLAQYLETCERLGLDPIETTPCFKLTLDETLEAARTAGLLSAPSEDALAVESAPKQVERQVVRKKVPAPNFTDFAKSYLDLRCQGYSLRRDDEAPHAATGAAFERTSLRNWQSSVRIFSEIVGDFPLGEYTKDEILAFNAMVPRLPANFGKSSRDTRTARQVIEYLAETEEQVLVDLISDLRAKGKPPAEIEDAVAAARTQRISATTVKRHQTALQSIFDHAFKQRLIDSNPFKGRILTDGEVKRWKKSEARIERTGWGDAIYTLLGSEKFRDPLSDIGEPLFWAPLIAMYAGLRLEEICQLRIRDFGTEGGIPFVAVQNELGSQSLKSDNSLRRVPLHRALIDLGLPQLVELRRDQGMSRLFPDLDRSKSKGTLSANMSKKFGYYIRSRDIKDAGLDFHALRTEFLVRLTRARVPDHVRKGLMGHEQTDVTHANYYRAGETISSLKEYVDRNDIDHTGVLSPFGRAVLPAKAKLRIVK